MHYLGLDISKDTIDTYSDASGHLKIDNSIQGIQELLTHLQAKGLNKGWCPKKYAACLFSNSN